MHIHCTRRIIVLETRQCLRSITFPRALAGSPRRGGTGTFPHQARGSEHPPITRRSRWVTPSVDSQHHSQLMRSRGPRRACWLSNPGKNGPCESRPSSDHNVQTATLTSCGVREHQSCWCEFSLTITSTYRRHFRMLGGTIHARREHEESGRRT